MLITFLYWNRVTEQRPRETSDGGGNFNNAAGSNGGERFGQSQTNASNSNNTNSNYHSNAAKQTNNAGDNSKQDNNSEDPFLSNDDSINISDDDLPF